MKCDICGYKHNETVVRECEDGIIRCKICRDKAKYGHVITNKSEVPVETEDWKKNVEDCNG